LFDQPDSFDLLLFIILLLWSALNYILLYWLFPVALWSWILSFLIRHTSVLFLIAWLPTWAGIIRAWLLSWNFVDVFVSSHFFYLPLSCMLCVSVGFTVGAVASLSSETKPTWHQESTSGSHLNHYIVTRISWLFSPSTPCFFFERDSLWLYAWFYLPH
jgi:hypothetical protein